VKCEDKTLLHWTLNALNRHGYQCTFAPQADLPTLEAISANELKWADGGTTQVFTSFEGLLGSL
jgi:iron complex transport system ATP-binding protein